MGLSNNDLDVRLAAAYALHHLPAGVIPTNMNDLVAKVRERLAGDVHFRVRAEVAG